MATSWQILSITTARRSSSLTKTWTWQNNTLSKLLWKPKYQVITEPKNKIVSEIDCTNCLAVFQWDHSQMTTWDLSRNVTSKWMKLLSTVGKRITTYTDINPSCPDPGRREKTNFFTLLCGGPKGFMKALKAFWSTTKKCENKNLS